jgi:hypothetical protein
MLAIGAAVLFGVALLLHVLPVAVGGDVEGGLLLAGLLCLALHLAGIATTWRRRA